MDDQRLLDAFHQGPLALADVGHREHLLERGGAVMRRVFILPRLPQQPRRG